MGVEPLSAVELDDLASQFVASLDGWLLAREYRRMGGPEAAKHYDRECRILREVLKVMLSRVARG